MIVIPHRGKGDYGTFCKGDIVNTDNRNLLRNPYVIGIKYFHNRNGILVTAYQHSRSLGGFQQNIIRHGIAADVKIVIGKLTNQLTVRDNTMIRQSLTVTTIFVIPALINNGIRNKKDLAVPHMNQMTGCNISSLRQIRIYTVQVDSLSAFIRIGKQNNRKTGLTESFKQGDVLRQARVDDKSVSLYLKRKEAEFRGKQIKLESVYGDMAVVQSCLEERENLYERGAADKGIH